MQGKGFAEARNLTIGDKLLLADGTIAPVTSIGIEQLQNPDTTYNFEVADFHTYYVSESKVLVHNDCISDRLKQISEEGKLYGCDDTANEMERYLNSKGLKEGVDYNRINIQTPNQTGIWSDSLSDNISTNGCHVGIEYKGLIYDNLSAGVSYKQ